MPERYLGEARSPTGWLRDDDGRALDWSRIAREFAGPVEAIVELHRSVWVTNDPVVLELCRLRMATLLDFRPGLRMRSARARAAGLTEEKVRQVSHWPTSPLFTGKERACLALAEQILMDVAGTTDEQVGAVLMYLSPAECYRLVEGISAMEALQRLVLVLGLDRSPEQQWLDAVTPAPLAGGHP